MKSSKKQTINLGDKVTLITIRLNFLKQKPVVMKKAIQGYQKLVLAVIDQVALLRNQEQFNNSFLFRWMRVTSSYKYFIVVPG
jgi:hypothetical protein